MTKSFGLVLGAAVVATLAGCKNPNYKKHHSPAKQNAAIVATDPEPIQGPITVTPDVQPIEVQELSCTCPPGTKHAGKCACGAKDCKCGVIKAEAPAPVAPVSLNDKKPVEPETTEYIVQRGDYLAKISKRYNIKMDAIRRLNPQLKNDNVRIGQKIKLPGKIEVGAQTVPAGAFKAPDPKPAYTPYTGATTEYVVKSGDTLGKIAYAKGSNVRQVMELNGLTTSKIRVGQKLKVPAAATAAAAKPAVEKKPAVQAAAKPAPQPVEAAKPVAEPATPVEPAPVDELPTPSTETIAPVAETPAPAPAAVPDNAMEYEVQEGEDIIGVAIHFNLTPAIIREFNNLSADAVLVPGQKLLIPTDAIQR